MFEWLGRALRAYAWKDGRGYPDWAARYGPIARRLQNKGALRGRVLEVGANETGLTRFARVQPFVVDVSFEHIIAAKATYDCLPLVARLDALPFKAESFETVVCVDTFEHIRAAGRPSCVHELARVVRRDGTAVVAFPSGDAAREAEANVREAYRSVTGESLVWLEEHEQEGLPEAAAIRQLLGEDLGNTHRIRMEKNLNVSVWRWMWKIMLCQWPGRGNALFQALLRFLTPVISRLHFGPCYRTILYAEPIDGKTGDAQ